MAALKVAVTADGTVDGVDAAVVVAAAAGDAVVAQGDDVLGEAVDLVAWVEQQQVLLAVDGDRLDGDVDDAAELVRAHAITARAASASASRSR
jgi:hypothetical protein